ncbi:cation:proton antiporter [Candidatus Woesearchaeota archaeon]|nr:cation:proton antiporter [Candidatus Woesearchaeota archaeon]
MATDLISIGILFICAIAGGIIAARLKQPTVFGLLLVGAIIGPNALNLVRNAEIINIMADLGAILLTFAIGLEFNVSRLFKSGVRAVLIAFLKFGIVLFMTYKITLFMGLDTGTSLFIGIILSFSSTVVVVKILEQKSMFARKEVPLLIGILLLEDVFAIIVLTIFSSMSNPSARLLTTFEHIAVAISALIILYIILLKIFRHIVDLIFRHHNDESVFTFLSLGIGALFSYFAVFLGLPASSGAFLAGSLIASLPNAREFAKVTNPYAIMFTSIFFISMGTLTDFGTIRTHFFLLMGLLIAVFISRLVAIGLMSYLIANFRKEGPFFASIAMIPVGEFSLLIAKESRNFGLGGIDLVTITASLIFMSAICMSISINHSEGIYKFISSKVPLKTKLKAERISDFLRAFFDQLEIETSFTNKLKKESKILFFSSVIALFGSFGFFRIVELAGKMQSNLLTWLIYALGAVLLFLSLKFIYKKIKSVHYLLGVVLTNVDSSRNLKKCTKILNILVIAFTLFFIALIFPFVIFGFKLGSWANFIPFVLGFMGFYYVEKLIALILGSPHYPQFGRLVFSYLKKFSKAGNAK